MNDKLEKIKNRVEEIGLLLMNPDVLRDNKKVIDLSKELKNLTPVANLYTKFLENENNLKDAENLLTSEKDEQMKMFLSEEINQCKNNRISFENELKVLLLPKDENDEKNVILEIRSGAGGDEASLFGAEVLRMYLRFAERNRWKTEIMDYSETELGGLKEATVLIKGNNVYAKMKYESGVHRVQRVPETETQGRVHTSTITVAVLPEQEDVNIEVLDKDLKIDTYRASGAGGQHVNKTDSAVRITHLPTGIVVACQDERSQIKNRERAMHLLKNKLYDIFKTQADEQYAANRKSQVGSGDRSERIRTYNFPQGRVTDHRIGLTLYSIESFMDGDLIEMIKALEFADEKAKLENQVN